MQAHYLQQRSQAQLGRCNRIRFATSNRPRDLQTRKPRKSSTASFNWTLTASTATPIDGIFAALFEPRATEELQTWKLPRNVSNCGNSPWVTRNRLNCSLEENTRPIK